MISPARRICYRLLRQIDSRRIFSDDALNSESVDRLEARDRHLTTEIVYGSLRWQALLDYILARASSRPWDDVEPDVKILLRMSLYQMWKMERIPDHALVNDAVELAKRRLGRGIERYINGVLRYLARARPWDKKEFILDFPPWIQVSLPRWLWERWADRFGESAARDFALSLNVPPQIALHPMDEPAGSGPLPFTSTPSDFVPGARIRKAGEAEPARGESTSFRYQDEASQLIPHLFGSIAGCRIWDACAAPGGKSAILCRNCGKSGHLVSSDLRWERISRLTAALRECSGRADVLILDAGAPAPFRDVFDAVLADVPCSGLGTLRRNPEIKWRFEQADFFSLQRNQKRILNSVAETVRIGGRLLYSTCSTEPEENEHVVESFLNTHAGFGLERPLHPPGIEFWTGCDHMVRTFPSARLWDGFFAALMIRRS